MRLKMFQTQMNTVKGPIFRLAGIAALTIFNGGLKTMILVTGNVENAASLTKFGVIEFMSLNQ